MECRTTNNVINAIKEVRELFNEETKRIRRELYKKEVVYNFLKEKKKKVVQQINKKIC